MRWKPSPAQRLLLDEEILRCSCICALPKKGNLEGIPVLLTPLLSRSFLQQELLENTSAEQSPKGHWQQIIPFLALDNLWGRLEACAGHKSLAAHIDSWGISVSSLSTPNNYHQADFRKCLFPWDASI